MIIHIIGESTTGKTTTEMLTLSTASYLDQNLSSKESLFRTLNNTKKPMFQPLVGNTGFPVIFDEFSMNNDYSITNLVYTFKIDLKPKNDIHVIELYLFIEYSKQKRLIIHTDYKS